MLPSKPTQEKTLKNERSDPDAVRHSFRVPVDAQEGICVFLNARRYPVTDMNPEGIRFLSTDKTGFCMGETIGDCRLEIRESFISGLSAHIIHCTPAPDNGWHIGLQWIDPDDDASKKIAEAVSRIKQTLRRHTQE